MKAYSQDLRDRVIELYNTGEYTKKALTKIFKLSYQTVFEWIKRYKMLGDYSLKQHIQTGRKASFTDKKKVIDFLIQNPDSQGVYIRDHIAPEIPMSTFYGTLRRMSITYKKKSRDIKVETRKREEGL
jgi:isftu1 transposase